jgi:hypothetical protein
MDAVDDYFSVARQILCPDVDLLGRPAPCAADYGAGSGIAFLPSDINETGETTGGNTLGKMGSGN